MSLSVLFQIPLICAVAGCRIRLWWAWAVFSGAVIWYTIFAILSLSPDRLQYADFVYFAHAGEHCYQGGAPYEGQEFRKHPILNPPTSLPLMMVFSLPPLNWAKTFWFVLNSVGIVGIVWGAIRLFGKQIPTAMVPLLLASVLTCKSTLVNNHLGQMSVMTAWCLCLALVAQVERKQVIAGMLLALASIKVGTAIPFLILIFRRDALKIWISGFFSTLLLILLSGRAGYLIHDLTQLVQRIHELSLPGEVNDYSFDGPYRNAIIGIDHLLYRLGFRDRYQIQQIQSLILGFMVCLLFAKVIFLRDRARSAALVCTFSVIFLYHRIYDLVLLALPLTYALNQWNLPRQHRWRMIVICSLVAMNLPAQPLIWVEPWALSEYWWQQAIAAILLPFGTWMILFILGLLWNPVAPCENSTCVFETVAQDSSQVSAIPARTEAVR